MEKYLIAIMERLRLEFYRRVFINLKQKESALSTSDVFSLEVINALKSPTISEFANFIGISQSNATYKIANLIKKGYIEKQVCMDDKREYHLKLTDKYRSYYDMFERAIITVSKRLSMRLPEKESVLFETMLEQLSEEIHEGLIPLT